MQDGHKGRQQGNAQQGAAVHLLVGNGVMAQEAKAAKDAAAAAAVAAAASAAAGQSAGECTAPPFLCIAW